MSPFDDRPWDQATDEELVERLIAAVQLAMASALREHATDDQWVVLPAPEAATALLNLLASVLEHAPQTRTPMGMRQVSEAAGKRLHLLMRGFREIIPKGESASVN